MEYGNAQTTARTTGYAAEARLSLFGDVNSQISAAMGRVIEATATARHVANGVFGPEPEPVAKHASGPSAPIPTPSRADETRNNLVGLHEAITTLEYQIGRLNQLA